jgi:hypothetical protein
MHKSLIAAMVGCALLASTAQPSAADQRRSGLDDLSNEMSTCSAYFSLLAVVVGNAKGTAAKGQVAEHIKLTGQAMLVQAINVANYIGLADDVVMQRVQKAMDEMVVTINADPPNSLAVMQRTYGQPCDVLLENASRRFADLIAGDRQDF